METDKLQAWRPVEKGKLQAWRPVETGIGKLQARRPPAWDPTSSGLSFTPGM